MEHSAVAELGPTATSCLTPSPVWPSRAEVANAATVNATPTATSLGVAFVHTERDARTRFTWGYSLGVGIDFLVTPNVFLRGEYEYIKLNAVGGVELAINTARFGAGVKF
jgi:opacity protein-like surface antigen